MYIVHTVITSMQKNPNILNLAAILQNGTNRSILGLSLLQGLPVNRIKNIGIIFCMLVITVCTLVSNLLSRVKGKALKSMYIVVMYSIQHYMCTTCIIDASHTMHIYL